VQAPPKRLYLIREGAMLAGVCNRFAAYLHIDPTIVRIIFAVLAVVTNGAFVFAYLVLAIVIPSANTPEQRAAAYGEAFDAQELIDRAKKNYAVIRSRGRCTQRGGRRHQALEPTPGTTFGCSEGAQLLPTWNRTVAAPVPKCETLLLSARRDSGP
jgi:phage shock protein C